MSVIDSLTKGFQSVHRHWWVLLISVLLDLFLWIGPHASVEQLMQDTVRSLEADVADLPTSTENAVDWREALNAIVTEVIPQYNGFSALRMGTLGVPRAAAAATAFIVRLATLWLAVVVGVAFLVGARRRLFGPGRSGA